jgi:phosphate:Na+ symporter
MTTSRLRGIFTGFGATTITQSSTTTTVMVVSFVNAGLITFIESTGVIMGANIGTTVTAWMVAPSSVFQNADYADRDQP